MLNKLFQDSTATFNSLPYWIQDFLTLLLAVLAGVLFRWILFKIVKSVFRKTKKYATLKKVLKRTSAVLTYLIPVILFQILLPLLHLNENTLYYANRIVYTLLIIGIAWFGIQAVRIGQDAINQHFKIDDENNLKARKVRTQVQFLKRLLIMAIIFVALAVLLLSFESVRSIGAGLLTSAGVTGIIIGFAAQKSIANLIAGFQIAFTQPIRIDDVVIVENEFARVEEITLTYVVVRIWDQRRLILPINYFIENTFQNWTRTNAEIMGTVLFYTDYSVPMEALRQELRRVCEESPYWDKRVCDLSMTDATEKSVQLRALVSAANAGNAWELRVYIREKLITYLQQNHPQSLPQFRASIQQPANATLNQN